MRKIFFLVFIIIGLSCTSGDDNNQVNTGDNNNSSCVKPNGLHVNTITSTSVYANWGDTNNSQLFNIEYGSRGFSLGNGTRLSSGSNQKQLTGLTSSTEYDFYVRANCGGNVFSNWAGPHSFVTN